MVFLREKRRSIRLLFNNLGLMKVVVLARYGAWAKRWAMSLGGACRSQARGHWVMYCIVPSPGRVVAHKKRKRIGLMTA